MAPRASGPAAPIPAGFEGGQLPLHMRVPKLKGFNNPFRVEYQGLNLDVLDASGLDDVTPETLHELGLTHKGALVKVLGPGRDHPPAAGQGPRLLEVGRGSHHRGGRYG